MTEGADSMTEFICEGCGYTIYTLSPSPPSQLCGECTYLDEVWRDHGLEVATAVAQTLSRHKS